MSYTSALLWLTCTRTEDRLLLLKQGGQKVLSHDSTLPDNF